MKRKVLVTGGARGIGRSIVEKFAQNGFDVVLTYLESETEAKKVKADFENCYGVVVDIYKLDIREEKEIEKLFNELDGLDVLVNNAAFNDDKDPFLKSQYDFMNILKVNLVGPFLMAKCAYPLLKERHGNVVNIASTNGIDTMYKESLDYDVSKAGLIHLTKSLASFFDGEVRVNAVAPGWVETEKTADINPKFKREEEEKIVEKRFARAEEVANVVYFVAKEEASYVNGAVLRVDGGVKYGN